MAIHNKKSIGNLINEIEITHPVTEWMHNGYHVWPILRISLYMYAVKKNESGNRGGATKKYRRFTQIKNLLSSIRDVIFLNPEIKNVYLGAPSHCVRYRGKEFNRYFDPMMDENDSTSLYLSKSTSSRGAYKPERHLSYTNLLLGYGIFDTLVNLFSGNSPHIKKLSEIIDDLQFADFDINGYQKKAASFLKTVEKSHALSTLLLKRIKPRKVFVLCYYSADVMGLVLAAHKLSIPTVDMQHGGHGKDHLAYSSWSGIPSSGYEALPNLFYTWDEASAKNINGWARTTKKHSARKFGNPWIESWKNGQFENKKLDWPKKIVLYTLQPIDEPLEPYLLKAITETKDKWNWWLRLHPRQMDEAEDIRQRLKAHNLLDKVNIGDATNLPLPEILTHSRVHITKFSGCAIEAYQFGTPTILIDEKGKNVYESYIQSDKLMYPYLEKSSRGLIEMINHQFYAAKKNN